ncbi:hypothetical protein F442_04812, partial [Phytophthora nicotianae P10297]
MARKVWFRLVDASTRGAFLGHKASSVPSDGVNDIEDLRNKIHAKYDHTRPQGTNILAHLAADRLDVYANRETYDEENGQPLGGDLAIGALGASEKGALIVVVPTQRLQQLQRPVSQVMDDEVNGRFRKRQKVICVERDTLLLGTAKALLEQIKGFDMDLAELNSVLDVPFPSLYDIPDHFQLDANRCFKYQARQELVSLYDRIGKLWQNRTATTHRDELVLTAGEGDKTIEIRPVVIYIPDCRVLLREDELVRVMKLNLLLNDLDEYEGLHSSMTPDDMYDILAGRMAIVVADQWNSIDDDDNAACIAAQTRLSRCLGISAMVTIREMSLNSTAWLNSYYKQQTGTIILVAGGFNENEFQVWMEHQNIELLKDHREELMALTGCVPLFLFRFARLHRENDTWPKLVQRVMSDKAIKNCLQCIETFYTKFDANTVWGVFAHLVPPASSDPDDDDVVDHRFFYFDEEHQGFSAIGEILTRLLYQ